MEPLVPTKTLLSIAKSTMPKSPLVQKGLVLLALCAIAAIIRRSFQDGTEAIVAGVAMMGGIVILTVVSYVAKRAPDPTVRYCARAVAVVLTALFLAACVGLCTHYFLGWPPSPVARSNKQSLESLDKSIRQRIGRLEQRHRSTMQEVDGFLSSLATVPWDELPSRMHALVKVLEANRDEVRVLVGGTTFEGTIDKTDAGVRSPLLVMDEPELLKLDLHTMLETRWKLKNSNSPIKSALESFVSSVLVLRVCADALPTFPNFARGVRGAEKTSDEYRSAYRESIRSALSHSRDKMNNAMSAISANELVLDVMSGK